MIHVLEKQIADKIAAGEVIERPVSIVKELIENSVDSGATSITCEIKNGGKSYIRVSDNGCGIPSTEVETAFLRHATSKINSVKDLDSIETLGFRGEALSSISAVTRTEIITKTRDEYAGKKVVLHGGEVVISEETGCPDGTTIIVTDLFCNTPARQKFLKSDSAEAGIIIDTVGKLALSRGNIRFKLINNGKTIFSTNGNGDILSNIIRIYSDVEKNFMTPVNYEGKISVKGFVSTPAYSKTSRQSQVFFVNNRVVNSKVIDKGVTLGYRERLFEGRYPICFLFIDIDPSEIDVNIHPSKKEVRFDNEATVCEAIGDAISDALKTEQGLVDAGHIVYKKTESINAPLTYFKAPLQEKEKSISPVQTEIDIRNAEAEIKKPKAEIKRSDADIKRSEIKDLLSDLVSKEKNISNVAENSAIQIAVPKLKPFDFTDLKFTGIIFDTYITLVDENNFYLMDQHAAQERIFYERLVRMYDSMEKNRQPLLIPILINVKPSAACDSENWFNSLDLMGFTIDEFGENTFRICEIPMFMEIDEAEVFVNTFIENISDKTDYRNTVVIDKLIMMSCKAAIKANDKISVQEAETLVRDLALCVNPYNCPHGRPTIVKMSRYEIEKMFKRV